MAVLAMLELDGDAEQLMAASAEVDRLRPAVGGLLLRMTAPTATGIVLFQLWESAEARRHNQQDPAHGRALEASGMKSLIGDSRARTFENVELSRLASTEVTT